MVETWCILRGNSVDDDGSVLASYVCNMLGGIHYLWPGVGGGVEGVNRGGGGGGERQIFRNLFSWEGGEQISFSIF